MPSPTDRRFVTATMVLAATLGSLATGSLKAQESRVFISIDLEGISGLVSGSQMGAGGADYAMGRALAEADANAAIVAAFDAGATAVVVIDSHGSKTNLRPDRVDPRAELITGNQRPLGMIHGIDETFDAVVFIGYHARAGTTDAIADHTYTGQLKRIAFNGIELGEAGLAGAVAGHYGVPVVFLSGDLAATKEAEAIFPGVETVAVKTAISQTAARILAPERARELISEGVARAVGRRAAVEPLRIDGPITVEIEVATSGQADKVMMVPHMERVSARVVLYVAPDAPAAYRLTRLVRLLAT